MVMGVLVWGEKEGLIVGGRGRGGGRGGRGKRGMGRLGREEGGHGLGGGGRQEVLLSGRGH